MKKLSGAKKRYLILLLLILLLGLIGWYKYPVILSNTVKEPMDIQLIYLKSANTGTSKETCIPQNDLQKQALFSLIKDIRFYKKFIQPSSITSYSEPTGQIEVYLYTMQNGRQEPIILSATDNGSITLTPVNSKDSFKYGVGYPGKRQERDLYHTLYNFYQSTLANADWKSSKE